eukprot:gene19741-biopygen7006
MAQWQQRQQRPAVTAAAATVMRARTDGARGRVCTRAPDGARGCVPMASAVSRARAVVCAINCVWRPRDQLCHQVCRVPVPSNVPSSVSHARAINCAIKCVVRPCHQLCHQVCAPVPSTGGGPGG